MTSFDLLFYSHLGFLALSVAGILVADALAMVWVRGARERIDAQTIMRCHWIVGTGLIGQIFTGLLLFWPMRQFLIGQPLFWLKIAFVTGLVINSFFIEIMMKIAVVNPFRTLTRMQRVQLFTSGAISTVSWVGAGVVSLVLFF